MNYIERFETVPLFIGLNGEQILKIFDISEKMAAHKGEVIVCEGLRGESFYIIVSGAYEVRKGGPDMPPVARLEELSFFGEMSLVCNAPRTATVMCVEAGQLIKTPIEKFNQLLDSDDIAAYKIIRNMSKIMAKRFIRLESQLLVPGFREKLAGSQKDILNLYI